MAAKKKSGTADNAERQAKAKAKKNNVPQTTVTKGNRIQVTKRYDGTTMDSYNINGYNGNFKYQTGSAPNGSRAASVAKSNLRSRNDSKVQRNNTKRK